MLLKFRYESQEAMSAKKRGNPISKASVAQPHIYKRTKRGPEPERLKITGVKNWVEAVDIAMQKPRPPGGWPK
jgi:hypothetical protein